MDQIPVFRSFLENLSDPAGNEWTVHHHETIPAKPPQTQDVPESLDLRAKELIRASGIESLYSHQAEAVRLSLQGENVVLATPTASGKTLAYQLSVINSLIRDPKATALFLFPLKALERDQRDAFVDMGYPLGLTAAVYDGDTPDWERRKIRKEPPRVIVTNPDMLHVALLAFHDTWKDFFANLCYVVLDEVHTYKGIFGSHIAQVLMRTRRVCNIYGSDPQFFASSATVANPGEFVSRLIGQPTAVVDESGAPTSERHFLFLDPVLSPYTVATRLFIRGLEAGLKTIVFTRARKITELITRWVISEAPELKRRISSYRAGFLPEERREIESRLFSGKMDGVISTSALEMGIDVGGLDLCILVGYPGTIINTWQRGGRVGRAGRPSAIALIAGNDALDQYFLKNPQDFFGRNCEEAILDPFNREVLRRHLPCAAAETPLLDDEQLTGNETVRAVINELEDEGTLCRSHRGDAWYSPRRRPQRSVGLRDVGESYSIFLEDRKTLIGSSSGVRVFTECHEGATYLHRARQYVVTKLDMQRHNVLVKPARLNYYTRALSEKDTEILRAPSDTREFPGYTVREGQLKVTQTIFSYEKRRTKGQELIGLVDLDLPNLHFETVGIWIEIPEKLQTRVKDLGLHFMGGIHALEHAAISMFPLFALCDRDDIGGISTPKHEQVGRAAVFIYDGHPGGVGLAHHIFGNIEELLLKTRSLVESCPCEDGCPSCTHSPKCGSGNKPLDKLACLAVLAGLLEPDRFFKKRLKNKAPTKSPIFPELFEASGSDHVGRSSKQDATEKTVSTSESMTSPRKLSHKRGSGAAAAKKIRKSSRAEVSGQRPAAPDSQVMVAERVVVFDLETQKLAQEVGGWKNIAKMRLSLGVAHCSQTGFETFTEDNVGDLIELLKSADLVVGFNQMRFDYEVLTAYTKENLRQLPNLDILTEVQAVLGIRLKLDHLAQFTLGHRKSGHGLEAVEWFREGKMDLLEKYCRDDVAITRDLFHFGLEKDYILRGSKQGEALRVPLNWSERIRLTEPQNKTRG
ncbi:DEAD/DEAH box helicase [Thermodesulfobacteriota bacterium]